MNGRIVYRENGVQIELDLFAPGLGHPLGMDIFNTHYRKTHRDKPVLFCEAGGQPEPVYLQIRKERIYASHFDGSACGNCAPSLMSDEHKRQVEYVVRAADRAGHTVDTEVSLGTGSRPDVVVYGNDHIAIEVQRSHLTKREAIGRTARTMAAGLATSVWISDRDAGNRPDWLNHVPSTAMNKLPWDIVPPHGSATATSLRQIVQHRCTWPCPDTGGRPCGGWHVRHEPWLGLTVDDVVEMAPERGIVPLDWFGKDVLLVPPKSAALYAGVTGRSREWRPAVKEPTNQQRRRIECARPHAPQPAGICCGERSPFEPGALKLACQLCPKSPTYWRRP